jgi:hypothetical protein
MPDHLPLEAWERTELMSKLWAAQQAQRNIQKELDRRGDSDEWKWAYEVPVYDKLPSGATVLTWGYHLFDSAAEAYDGAREIAAQLERDPETAPYHVHKVWLPASVDGRRMARDRNGLGAKPDQRGPARRGGRRPKDPIGVAQ